MVSQVPIIGILMIVNGILCILYGFVQMAMGPFMQSIFAMQGAQMPPEAKVQMQQMQQMMQYMFWVYIALGTLNAVVGVVSIAAGIPAMRYRSRTFVIIALFLNPATFMSCYCLPTSLGLMIWGLIVLLQKDVAEAFKMGAAGISADEIKQRFADDRRRDDDYDDDPDDRRSRRSRTEPPSGGPPPLPGDGHDGIREL
jgi:hypothetical protein